MDITRVHFEDKGQDFLWWDIDENGVVVDCGPFQASIWVNCVTDIPDIIYVYDYLNVVTDAGEITLKYQVIKKEPAPQP